MSNLIKNLFVKPACPLSWWKRGIPIPTKYLQRIEPGLIINFCQASDSVIKGFIDRDAEFLKSTLSPYLYSQIANQLGQMGPEDSDRLRQALKLKDSDENPQVFTNPTSIISVYPYVVFGGKVKERINDHPLSRALQLTRNRFLQLSEIRSLGDLPKLKTITYGFKCEVLYNQTQRHAMTFEGDLSSSDFYVVDLNNQLWAQASSPSGVQ